MSRFTKRFRNKRNKTIKQNGGLAPENTEVRHEREGVVDMVGDKIYNSVSGVATKVTDVLLDVAGLERKDAAHDNISNQDETANNANANTNTNSTLNKATSYVSDLGANAFNKANTLLSSETTKQGVKEAAESVADTIKDNLTILNDSLNQPEVKAKVEEFIEKSGEIAGVAEKAFEKPLENMTNKVTDIVKKKMPELGTTAVNTLNAVGEGIPVIGTAYAALNIINNLSKGASAVIEAGTEATEAASDAFIDTSETFKSGMKELNEKKKLSQQISKRTNDSIKNFENPYTPQTGGNKTRRRLFKRKGKSKRVRFAV